jgi:lipopolysaccharide/colanic/teichoic acid biosynthesis glycosyltransferase
MDVMTLRTKRINLSKRLFDIAVSSVGLLVLSPVIICLTVVVTVFSRGPVFFCQERIGWRFRAFRIYKFRTMIQAAPTRGGTITIGDDPRITGIGRILRATKLDELPQLINVLKGDMSLVGPRPEVPRYVEMFREEYEEILTVRPGITDLASIKYRDEAAVLAKAEDPEKAYIQVILPEKIRFAKEYIRRSSLSFDLYLIILTILKIATDHCSSHTDD